MIELPLIADELTDHIEFGRHLYYHLRERRLLWLPRATDEWTWAVAMPSTIAQILGGAGTLRVEHLSWISPESQVMEAWTNPDIHFIILSVIGPRGPHIYGPPVVSDPSLRPRLDGPFGEVDWKEARYYGA